MVENDYSATEQYPSLNSQSSEPDFDLDLTRLLLTSDRRLSSLRLVPGKAPLYP